MALPLSNTFETGLADETAITIANSGDGSAGDAFTLVDAGGGSIVYDTLRAAHGSLSAKYTTGGTPSRQQVQWDSAAMGTQTSLWGRIYVYRTANPVAEHQWLVRPEGTGGSGTNGVVAWLTNGHLNVWNTDFGSNDEGTVALSLNTWVRIEWRLVTNATTGIIEAFAYEADSTSALDSVNLTNVATGTNCTAVSYGDAIDTPNVSDTFWIDDLNVNGTGYPGPVVEITPQPSDDPPISRLGRGAGW